MQTPIKRPEKEEQNKESVEITGKITIPRDLSMQAVFAAFITLIVMFLIALVILKVLWFV